jgi:2,4-dienoyl-CoA reductase-like NADH-dependent reductase (Old Yellow Enzyme family)
VAAIVRAKAAGFDGVELHAAHGYLLSEFISPVLNRRKDMWGGSTQNRLRIVTEILSAARREVGKFPILIKISAHDEFKQGLPEAEAVTIAQMLQAASCDAIEVSCGYGDFMHTVRMTNLPVDAVLGLMPHYRDMPSYRKYLFRLISPFLAKVHKPISN